MRNRALILLALFVCSMHAFAAMRVKSFETSILVDGDGAAVVNESISFFSPQREFVRTIHLRTPGHEDTPLVVRILDTYDDSGHALTYTTQRDDYLSIHVTGLTATARFTYFIPNAMRFAGDHDELIWPATDPAFATSDADIRVALPPGASGQFTGQAFLQTRAGRRVAVWSSTGELPIETDSATLHTHSPGPIGDGIVFTIGVFLNKGVLSPPSPLRRAGWYVGANRIVLFPFATLIAMLFIRRLRPRLAKRAIATCYEPPEGLTPAEIGTLADDHVDPRDVAATLADLAVRGFIRFDAITAESNDDVPDFKLTLLRPHEQWTSLAPHERTMLFHTFYGGHWTQLSSLRLRFPSIVPLFTDDVMESLRNKGLYTTIRFSPWVLCQTGFLTAWLMLLFGQWVRLITVFDSPIVALASLAVSALIILVLGGRLSSKTRRGQRVWADIRGFEEFLSRVDADRLHRLTPDLYEKYLPYAMALGVEQAWTSAFDGIAVPVPDWFGADGGLSDPAKFRDSLHAFLTHTLHEIRTARAPRLQQASARAAKAT